jgi:hypothetical protein
VLRALNEEQSFAPADGGERGAADRNRRVPGHVKVEKEALRLLLTDAQVASSWVETLEDKSFTSPPRRELFARIRDGIRKGERLDSSIGEELSADASTLFSEIAVGEVRTASSEEDETDIRDGAREIFARLQLFSLERDIKVRRTTLQELNPLDDAERHDALFTELVGLEAARRDLLRSIQGAA